MADPKDASYLEPSSFRRKPASESHKITGIRNLPSIELRMTKGQVVRKIEPQVLSSLIDLSWWEWFQPKLSAS